MSNLIRLDKEEKKKLFYKPSFLSEKDYNKFINVATISDEGLYSISKPREIKFILNLLNNLQIEDNLSILELTGGVGGVSLGIIDYICTILKGDNSEYIIYEKNELHRKIIKNNLNVLSELNNKCKNHISNIIVKNEYTMLDQFQPKYKNIVYFIDPPWGGPSYKTKSKISLKLSEDPLDKIVNKIITRSNGENIYIFIKVPFNFDYHKFVSDVANNKVSISKKTIMNYYYVCMKKEGSL